MKVNGIFESIQGEGIHIGLPMIFIRFSGCNLNCKWCDTKYHVEGNEMSPHEITIQITQFNSRYVFLTGGEPLVQNTHELIHLISLLQHMGCYVILQTNGTLFSEDYLRVIKKVDFVSVDYKLPSSGELDHPTNLIKLIHYSPSQVKFVVKDKADYERMIEVIFKIEPHCPIIVQPCGFPSTGLELTQIYDLYKIDKARLWKYDLRFLPQLHKILWDPQERNK